MLKNGVSFDTAPVSAGVDVTKDDTAEVKVKNHPPRAFMCDGAGTLNITLAEGGAMTITVLSGVIYPMSVKHFRTGGTATGIHAFG